jgi:hypothetical protein
MEKDQKEIFYTKISYAYPPIFIDNETMIDVH